MTRFIPRTIHVTTADVSLFVLLRSRLEILREHGFEVATASAPGPYSRTMISAGFRHFVIPALTRKWRPSADLKAMAQLYQTFRTGRYDIVTTYGPKPGIYGRIAARLAGIPIVAHTNWGLYFSEDSDLYKKLFFLSIEYVAARFGDHVFSVNRDDMEIMVRFGMVDKNDITYIGNGTNLNHFNPKRISELRLSQLRSHFGLESNKVTVGMVGRLVREKGCFEFFKAAKNLTSRLSGLQFLHVGPLDTDKEGAVTEEEFHRMQREDKIKFLGMQENMPEIYALMDVVVLPSHREGFPRSLVEAAAMGKPLVASNVRGCREAVEPGVNGFLVAQKDPEVLAEAIT
ncbi:MAG TPA: glycosyltransferase family 1 protein, partial [Desulfobacterales bacterium]|nr:glycosyltransferase family 1 protein [Desulfobacterales bacterium]